MVGRSGAAWKRGSVIDGASPEPAALGSRGPPLVKEPGATNAASGHATNPRGGQGPTLELCTYPKQA